MAILRKVCLSSEYRRALQKQFVIRRLHEMEIYEHNGRDIHELNYDELKRILALTRATRS